MFVALPPINKQLADRCGRSWAHRFLRLREGTSISADVGRTITPEMPNVKAFCGNTAGYRIERSTAGDSLKQLQIDEPIFPAFSL
jgi:hypothetical protein